MLKVDLSKGTMISVRFYFRGTASSVNNFGLSMTTSSAPPEIVCMCFSLQDWGEFNNCVLLPEGVWALPEK